MVFVPHRLAYFTWHNRQKHIDISFIKPEPGPFSLASTAFLSGNLFLIIIFFNYS